MSGDEKIADPRVARAATIARLLDKSKIDPILGLLIPGAGDLLSAAIGVYVISVASSRRVSKVLIARMVINLATDTILGVIPLVGDIFDFFFRANERNMKLLVARHETKEAKPGDWLHVVAAGAIAVLAVAIPIVGMILLVRWIF